MRILCFIENLSQGGAETQLVNLACLLKKRGQDVQFLVYHKADHFMSALEKAGILVESISARNRIYRIWVIRKSIRRSNPDVVIAFKKRPSLYAELAGLFRRNFKLVVSERSYDYLGSSIGNRIRFFFHRFSDSVVANSISQYEFIRSAAPALRNKTYVVRNCLDLDSFVPQEQETERSARPNCLKLIVLARFAEVKNPFRFLEAVRLLQRESIDFKVVVDWHGENFIDDGEPTKLSKCYIEFKKSIVEYSLTEVFRLHKPAKDVVPLLHNCDALCSPSIYEGFSNAIAEAIACGKPVLASNISDNVCMVKEGSNGFLFAPDDPADIARAIREFASLECQERTEMSRRSRQIAESLLSPSSFIEKYETIISNISA